MGLSSKYTVSPKRLPDLFDKIRDGQAPDQLTHQLLKDWGFTSSNDRALIQVLKELGFLSPDGKPTSLYHEYRDHSQSKVVMAKALREAYGDIFLIKANPTDADKNTIKGKFKSFHNTSDNVATLMANNFLELTKLADLSASSSTPPKQESNSQKGTSENPEIGATPPTQQLPGFSGLHYNIQIHLPATKDVEVYNAIFKSLKEHLIEK